jgi:tetratricopeptide (TPR) repeat protein
MHSCQRFGYRLIATLFLLAIWTVLGPSESHASGAAEAGKRAALSLVRSGDIDKIEHTFDTQYQDFVAGKITIVEFNSPYNAFYTLEPLVLEVVAEWRKAKPNSAHARVAEAGFMVHLAAILRGEDVLRLVPRTSYAKAWQLWTEARALYSEALDIAPIHLRAATNLKSVAQDIGDKQAEMRGKRIVAVHGSHVSLLLSELRRSSPQWGGSVAMMRRLCDTVAPKVEGISAAECHARATLILWDTPREQRDEALEVLRREDEEGNRFTIARELLHSGRAQEALDLYDEVDAPIPVSLAPVFSRALNNYAIQERIADRRLAVNPLHPRHLALKSESQGRRGDFAGAAETIEKAMIYGETIPVVRRWRLAAMRQDKSRNGEVLGELEDALVDTDFHPVIMEITIASLVWSDRFRYWSDGSEHSRFECRRLRIISNANNSCSLHPERASTLGCSDGSLARVMEIITAADMDACGDLPTLLPVQ